MTGTQPERECRIDEPDGSRLCAEIPRVVESLAASCRSPQCYDHVDATPFPSRQAVVEIIHTGRDLLFPGYFSSGVLEPVNLAYYLGQKLTRLYELLAEQITRAVRHDCVRYELDCTMCGQRGQEGARAFLEALPRLRRILAGDVRAALEGDPAAKSADEVIFSYPGLLAVTIYRMAHVLYELEVPLLPRMMTEYAHSRTGIDIHPGAQIGESFFIDHGTGVVIGETCRIGRRVRIYQGVTLGALSLPRGARERLQGTKRHPTIEDDVIIYSGATILGGDTVIGARSVVGGNVWLTQSLPPDTKVFLKPPELVIHDQRPA